MLPVRIKITEINWPSKRAFNRAAKAAHRAVGEQYHRVMIPQHFKPGADKKYRMRRRKKGYREPDPSRRTRNGEAPTVIGRAIGRGQAIEDARTHPLVFSGALRRSLTQLADIRGYPTRATVTMIAPTYTPSRQRATSNQPPVADEATRLTRREQQQSARTMREEMQRELKAIPERRTRRLR